MLPAALRPGSPWPLGATWTGDGVNFALYSGSAERVELWLFGQGQPMCVPLAATDQVWHGFVPGLGPGQRYGYRVHGPYDPARGLRFNPHKLLLDPYAKAWDRDFTWADPAAGHQLGAIECEPQFDPRDNGGAMAKSVVIGPDGFDWGEDAPPAVPLADTVIYELHVKGFTRRHPDVPEALRGRFLGLVEPAPLAHLKRLGVTAIELMPIMAFIDEPVARQRGLTNYWGYNTLGFFLPDRRYAVEDARRELKSMVRRLHQAGLEVILDVVLNHTGEGDHAGPILAFRGIDNPGYYRLRADDPSRYENPTGTGNALDFRRPRVVQLALDALRWWVGEYHVDGFRFDLATVLARGPGGVFDPAAPFLAAVAQDPVLQRVKLIAEPWDAAPGGWQVGGFPPGWAEWNDRSRDDLRRFLLRRAVGPGFLATRLAGSSDLFRHDGRAPRASVNFVACHDGFTLADLVSYEAKRNLANGEENRDGTDASYGWNAGVEGPSDDPAVRARRDRLRRALLAALMACRGVPMLTMGDELGHSQGGNNNAWCQDNELTWLDWEAADQALAGFTARLIGLRRDLALLRGADWLSEASVVWLAGDGGPLEGDRWDAPPFHGLGMRLKGGGAPDLLVLVNGGLEPFGFMLPAGAWRVRLDSAADEAPPAPVGGSVLLAGSSVQFLEGVTT